MRAFRQAVENTGENSAVNRSETFAGRPGGAVATRHQAGDQRPAQPCPKISKKLTAQPKSKVFSYLTRLRKLRTNIIAPQDQGLAITRR